MADNNTPSELSPQTGITDASRPPKPAEVAGYKIVWDAVGKVWTYAPASDTIDVTGDDGGGGGGKKAPDPYAPIMRSFFSAYFKIWGTLPPPGYVEGAARSMNLYEFIDQERKKPAYRHTKAYKNEAAKYAALRDQLLGYY